MYVKEAVSQAIIRRTLEKLGYQVVSLVNVADLCQIGPERVPSVLVAECSLLTSETECLQVQRLKERFPQLRILGLTHDTSCGEIPPELPFVVEGYLKNLLPSKRSRLRR